MRTSYSLIFLSLVCVLLTACGKRTVEERVYGTWVEPLNGAVIEFREDGSMTWNGQDGRFRFVRSTNWAVCIGRSGCDDGQVSVSLPNQSFRLSIYTSSFDANPDRFSIHARNTAGYPKDVRLYGIELSGFSVYRQGTFEGTLMPESFARADEGIGANGHFGSYMGNSAYAGGSLVADFNGSLYRFDEDEERWTRFDESSYDFVWPPTGDALYRNSPPNGQPDKVSFDAGRTWRVVRDFDVETGLRNQVTVGELTVGDTAVTAVANLRDDEEYGAVHFWSLDLADEDARWVKRGERPAGTVTGLSHEYKESGLLVAERYADEEVTFQISADLGATWQVFTNPCRSRVEPHVNGVYCANENGELAWYDAETNLWTNYDVGFELSYHSLANVGSPADSAYLIHNDELIAWRAAGSEVVTELSANITGYTGAVHVFDDQVFVNKITIWRTER